MSILTSAEKIQLWVVGLAVLKCPMSIEDKIVTLESAIVKHKAVYSTIPDIPETGLTPFDSAVKKEIQSLNALYSASI